MMLCGTKTPRRFLPQDGHFLRRSCSGRTQREGWLLLSSLFPFTITQNCVQSVKQGSSSLPSSSSGASCFLGRLAEDAKEKEMWEDSGWPEQGGREGRNTITQTKKEKRQKLTKGRNEDLEGVKRQ